MMERSVWSVLVSLILAIVAPPAVEMANVPVCKVDHEQRSWSEVTVYDERTLMPAAAVDVKFTQVDIDEMCRLHFSSNNYSLLTNGSVIEKQYGVDGAELHTEGSYCVQPMLGVNDTKPHVSVCFPDDPLTVVQILLMTASIISIVSIVIVLIVYALLPKLRNMHGKTLMCHSVSLFCTYMLLVLAYTGSRNKTGVVSKSGCVAISHLLQYFLLSSLMWLAVISFDIFRKFRNIMPPAMSNRSWRLLLIYNLIAWGIPALPVVLASIADKWNWIIRPFHGFQTCWINHDSAKLAYVYVPASLMLLANLVFFCLTTRAIFVVRRQTSTVLSRSSSTSQARMEFVLYIKLFLVMGLTWIMEVISWVCQEYINPNLDKYFLLTDVINALQGFLILVVLVSKKETLKQIFIAVGLRKEDSQSPPTNSSTHSSQMQTTVAPAAGGGKHNPVFNMNSYS